MNEWRRGFVAFLLYLGCMAGLIVVWCGDLVMRKRGRGGGEREGSGGVDCGRLETRL